jgi:uncharacterized protein (DUF952 family)
MYINPNRSIGTEATVVKGYQKASGLVPYLEPGGTIKAQLPHFKRAGLDLLHCFHGTLNLAISPLAFKIVKPLAVCRGVLWSERHAPEDFYFARTTLRYAGRSFDGCIYYPDPAGKVQHFHNSSTLEILAPPIPGIGYGSKVVATFDLAEVSLSRDGRSDLLHIAARSDWEDAQRSGTYRVTSLEKEGFIHTSMRAQVVEVANRLFRSRDDLFLLVLLPEKLGAPLLFETAENGQLYPHVYGSIPVSAVARVVAFPALPDGHFELPAGM